MTSKTIDQETIKTKLDELEIDLFARGKTFGVAREKLFENGYTIFCLNSLKHGKNFYVHGHKSFICG